MFKNVWYVIISITSILLDSKKQKNIMATVLFFITKEKIHIDFIIFVKTKNMK